MRGPWCSSFIIGLTLAVNSEFVTLFVVLVFHRTSPLSLPPSHTDIIVSQKCSRD